MRILAINGSPKGKQSNTWRLTSASSKASPPKKKTPTGKRPQSMP